MGNVLSQTTQSLVYTLLHTHVYKSGVVSVASIQTVICTLEYLYFIDPGAGRSDTCLCMQIKWGRKFEDKAASLGSTFGGFHLEFGS